MQKKVAWLGPKNAWLGPKIAWLGLFFSVGIVLYGSIIPWVRFAVFGTPIEVPGVALGGAATITLAFFTLTFARKLPLLRLVLGVLIIAVALYAQKNLGETVVRQMLGIERSLGEVNSRLAQVTLPPIEPFSGFQARREHLGPGPLWTMGGGAGIVLCTLAQMAVALRFCPHCRARWKPTRTILFCPQCGKRPEKTTSCPQCGAETEQTDTFCVGCGNGPLLPP
jgi:Double zinc ribbon